MNLNEKVSIGIRRFFKKYGRIILIAGAIWLIIIMINQILKANKKPEGLKNTLTAEEPIMDEGDTVPNSYKKPISSAIEKYFNSCNTKDYETAFDMLTPDCKNFLYDNSLNTFKEYVDNVYTSTKTYNIQNYSNVDGVYIYDMMILDDIETTGTTGEYNKYKEKVAVTKVGTEFKLSNQGYIDNIKYNTTMEDDFLKVNIYSKDCSYKKESYNMTITNKTDKYILISDNSIKDEITLNLGDQLRPATNLSNATLLLSPGEKITGVALIFDKFYDDGKNPTEINFNAVRVIENYSSSSNGNDNSKLYSINVKLNK